MSRKIRVVVTGIGVITSIGIGLDTFWRNLLAGRSGISKVSTFDATNFRTHKAGQIKNFNPGRFMENPEDKGRATQFLLAATKLAIKDARLNLPAFKSSDIGLIVGTTAFELSTLEQINQIRLYKGINNIAPSLITKGTVDTTSIVIGRELGLNGVNLTIPTACAAGNYAIGYGFDLIKQGKAKIIFSYGVDAFSRVIFTGFNRLFIVAPDRCRPFDKNRKGMMIGEGAAVLVLETLEGALQRKANIYAEVLGYGLSCDAYSTTIPSKEGIKRVMQRAIKNSHIRKEDIDYINAHGTGTTNNDRNEAQAIKQVFGSNSGKIPVSSIKSMLGHTIGAASAIEAVSCCLTIKGDIIPPTINYQIPDPECDINIVANKPRKKRVNIAMNNSFAFGGNNACVIFGKVKR